jgi:tyrosyl-tRNA synthetase
VPTFVVPAKTWLNGKTVIDLLVEAKLAKTRGEARRLIRGDGVRLNNVELTDELLSLDATHFPDNRAKLTVGKKRLIFVQLQA